MISPLAIWPVKALLKRMNCPLINRIEALLDKRFLSGSHFMKRRRKTRGFQEKPGQRVV
ncbi:MAG: hypothetical protein ACYDCP_08430 [Thermoplasmataceae archaeon]